MTTPSSRFFASHPDKQGLTVFELLVVVVIVGVVAMLAVPAISRTRGQANDLRCVGQLRQIGGLLQTYTVENRGYLPSSYHRSAINPNGNRYWFEQLAHCGGQEIAQGLRSAGNLFQCPNSKRQWAVEGQRFFGNYGWNIAVGNEWREDEFQPYLNRYRRADIDASKVIVLADTNHGAYAESYVSHWFSAPNYLDARHAANERTHLLYADGSVRALALNQITQSLLNVTLLP